MIKFKYATRKDRKFPIIPITLIKENVEIDTDALIDSGANICSHFALEYCLSKIILDKFIVEVVRSSRLSNDSGIHLTHPTL